MKNLLALTIAVFLAFPAFAADAPPSPSQDTAPKISTPAPLQLPNQNNETCDPVARRGCCSHHNGVCGCSGGRTTCCDGTTSPSCACYGYELES